VPDRTTRSRSPLDLLCRWLAAAHAGQPLDDASAAALTDPRTDLIGLVRLAGRHCITPMLATAIGGALRQRLPADFARYLEFIRDQNRRRNQALRAQLGEIVRALNEIGIEPLLLKGATRLVDGLYRDPGWRFMRDLDLLVPIGRRADAVARLAAAGFDYTRDPASWPEGHKHLAPLGRDGDPAVVELHGELLSKGRELCPTRQALERAHPVEVDGGQAWLLHPVDQLAVLIAHDRHDEYLHRSGMFLLRSVFESALLSDDDAVKQLLARAEQVGMARAVHIWLELIAGLFPDHTRAPTGVDRHARLQARTLIAAERWDQNGSWRRLLWFVRLRIVKLLMSPEERAHIAANILTLDYGRRSLQRLHRLWVSD
jgi:hypothetical protein